MSKQDEILVEMRKRAFNFAVNNKELKTLEEKAQFFRAYLIVERLVRMEEKQNV